MLKASFLLVSVGQGVLAHKMVKEKYNTLKNAVYEKTKADLDKIGKIDIRKLHGSLSDDRNILTKYLLSKNQDKQDEVINKYTNSKVEDYLFENFDRIGDESDYKREA